MVVLTLLSTHGTSPPTLQVGHQTGGKYLRSNSDTSLHCHQARTDGIDKK